MSKTKILLLLFAMMTANIISANAQKIDEGKAVYEISYPDTDIPEEQMAMMPTESIMYFKNNQSRMEMKMGAGMSMVMLLDNKTKTITSLMDILGNKTAVKMTEDDLKKKKEKEKKDDYQVKLTDETKDIAGYKCKKAVVSNKEGSFDVYYTDQVAFKKGDWVNEFKGIDGFLMQFKRTDGAVTMQLTAKNISKEKVEDVMFTVPPDYKYTTQEEIMKQYGGGK